MNWALWNPIAGQHVNLNALRGMATPSARSILDIAEKQCYFRTELAREAGDMLAKAVFPAPPPALPVRPPCVDGFDILVATACLERDLVAERMPHGLAPTVWQTLDERTEALRAFELPTHEVPLLHEQYARRWAWNGRVRRWRDPISVDALLGSLSFDEIERMADWDAGYSDGYDRHYETAVEMWAPLFEEVPSPYLERQRELRLLDRTMEECRGALIVGPEGSGRRALIRAWLARTRCGDMQTNLWGDSYQQGLEGVHTPLGTCSPQPSGRVQVEALVDGENGHSSETYDRVKEGHWLVATTPQLLGTTRSRVDPKSEMGVVDLSPPSEEERIATWLCGAADGLIEDPLARTLSVLTDRIREVSDEPWSSWGPDGRMLKGWNEAVAIRPKNVSARLWVLRCLQRGVWRVPNPTRWRPLESLADAEIFANLIDLERQLMARVSDVSPAGDG